eukprot:6197816-Pleurochrysis_carterae.AAC.3
MNLNLRTDSSTPQQGRTKQKAAWTCHGHAGITSSRRICNAMTHDELVTTLLADACACVTVVPQPL